MISDLVESTTTSVEQLASVCWSEVSESELPVVLRRLEEVSRRVEAISAAGAAEAAGRAERAGRSVSSAATSLGRDLGLTAGQCRARIDAGRRQGSPAMEAHRRGRITAGQERAIGEAVAELPEGAPDEAREDFSRHLTGLAQAGASVRALTAAAARELAKADPGRLERLEEMQQKRRELRAHRPGLDGLASMGITAEPRLQALLAAVIARFGGPGQCIAAPADPESGGQAGPEALAADDTRTAGQRAYDALCHVLALGLAVEPGASRGVAAIVVRLTPEHIDAVEAGEPGGLVDTDGGVQLSAGQAVSLAGRRSWFLSALRDGREELRRIDVDRGRDRRLASAMQRLVLYAAHGGCTHPGCEQPAAQCQGHHVTDWSRGGPTTVSNLALVCPVHHGWIGDGPGQWRTVPDPARPGMPRWIPPGIPARAA
ncbi:HNH endonuclease [Dietzia cinnamea]|uniref:HNH endonuclease n=1 Tax=Dietzia cinnamea TaxID=321318 RepID=A0ABV3YKJ5_9ACTN|nr:HNH endonuclease signature motif containing protein [Dietzia cinnamea]MCT2120029.1 HNH endonuclease [Dietzia cinnamea]MCT2144158.1 HNH endonuclease [Dietzia cinnamea]MCT2303027.1 HNH endonuclease [Dietzia cinnamea]